MPNVPIGNHLYIEYGVSGRDGYTTSEGKKAGNKDGGQSGCTNSYGYSSGSSGGGFIAGNSYGYQYSGNGDAGSAGGAGFLKIIW